MVGSEPRKYCTILVNLLKRPPVVHKEYAGRHDVKVPATEQAHLSNWGPKYDSSSGHRRLEEPE